MTEATSAPSRRSVMKGIAWTVPAIAVAATVPMAAASDPGTVPVIGDFWESSMQITKTKVGMSALFVNCFDTTNQTPWKGKLFDATIVVEYIGANAAFAFSGLVNMTHWRLVSQEPHRLEFVQTVAVNGCGTGALQFSPLDITFNGSENAPLQEPGPDSIRVTASAIAQDGTFAVGALLDATPCSPTKGAVPIGPRAVPGAC